MVDVGTIELIDTTDSSDTLVPNDEVLITSVPSTIVPDMPGSGKLVVAIPCTRTELETSNCELLTIKGVLDSTGVENIGVGVGTNSPNSEVNAAPGTDDGACCDSIILGDG